MINKQVSIQERTKKFAVRVVKAYVQINKDNHERPLGFKQSDK